MEYPGAEVARYLGVTTAAMNRLAVGEESAEICKVALESYVPKTFL